MKSRLRYLGIAFRNARGPLAVVPFLVLPALLLGWAVGVVVVPGPEDPLVNALSLLAAAGGFATLLGLFLNALHLRQKYPPLVVVGGGLCILLSAFCFWQELSPVL